MPLEFHEPRDQLPEEVIDQHRAVTSLIEEFEAVMWYQQRAAVTQNADLRAVLLHNRNEELEHAAMNLEWLRRNWPEVDEVLRTYLFTQAPITEVEELATGGQEPGGSTGPSGGGASDGSLGIGSMKQGRGG